MKSRVGQALSCWIDRFSIEGKTRLLILLIGGGMISIILMLELLIVMMEYENERLYRQRIVPIALLEETKEICRENIYDTLYSVNEGKITRSQAKEVISSARSVLGRNWKLFLKNLDEQKEGGRIESLRRGLVGFLVGGGLSDRNDRIVMERYVERATRSLEEIDRILRRLIREEIRESSRELKTLYRVINRANVYLGNLIRIHLKSAEREKWIADELLALLQRISFVIVGLTFLISLLFAVTIIGSVRDVHRLLERSVRRKTRELEELNASLERRIIREVESSRRKDRMMFQQAKLARMGEMLQNIAHQWRQPLGAISMIAQSFRTKSRLGKLTPEYLEREVEHLLEISRKMSHTIDDFRDFFQPDKGTSAFFVHECVEHAFKLTEYSLRQWEIRSTIHQKEPVHVISYFNELSHVLLNLIGNSVDILKKIEGPRYIEVYIKRKGSEVILHFIDNAGGVPPEIECKIFEPYFTTKQEEHGTGVGLYMSKQIVEKHMGGKISYKSITHRFGTKRTYRCAMFTITIPCEGSAS